MVELHAVVIFSVVYWLSRYLRSRPLRLCLRGLCLVIFAIAGLSFTSNAIIQSWPCTVNWLKGGGTCVIDTIFETTVVKSASVSFTAAAAIAILFRAVWFVLIPLAIWVEVRARRSPKPSSSN